MSWQRRSHRLASPGGSHRSPGLRVPLPQSESEQLTAIAPWSLHCPSLTDTVKVCHPSFEQRYTAVLAEASRTKEPPLAIQSKLSVSPALGSPAVTATLMVLPSGTTSGIAVKEVNTGQVSIRPLTETAPSPSTLPQTKLTATDVAWPARTSNLAEPSQLVVPFPELAGRLSLYPFAAGKISDENTDRRARVADRNVAADREDSVSGDVVADRLDVGRGRQGDRYQHRPEPTAHTLFGAGRCEEGPCQGCGHEPGARSEREDSGRHRSFLALDIEFPLDWMSKLFSMCLGARILKVQAAFRRTMSGLR